MNDDWVMPSDREKFLKSAEESRVIAENCWDPDAAQSWRRIADNYERLANSVLLLTQYDKMGWKR